MSDTTQQVPTGPPSITTAPYPFDKANADVILRTSDHVDFHVHSQILIVASPSFEGMFDVPQPPLDQQELKYRRPIINVSESSKALYSLLRICYPISKPKNRTLEEVELSLAAAIKFEMEFPRTVLTDDLEAFASSRPLEVWGIACMDGITAADYFRLREYRRLQPKTPEAFKFLSPVSLPEPSPVTASTLGIVSRTDAPPQDMTCRSADGIEFPAHRTVVSIASATLMAKVSSVGSLPPEEGSPSEPHVVQFEEGSVVLQAILELIYYSPADVALPTDPADLTAILVATEKYELHSAQPAVWSFWQTMASQNPLRAYCKAIRAGHEVGVKEAARCALNHVIEGVYVEELECTPALAYHRLLTYHERCRTAATTQLAKIIGSLKGPAPNRVPYRVTEWGHAAAMRPAPKKTTMSSSGDPVAVSDGPWLLRHLRSLSCRVRERPGSAMPGLADLFMEATKVWSDGKVPRVWCEECQLLAEEILEVNKGLQQLPHGLSEVSGFVRGILWGPTCSGIFVRC
ncbi:hypothetical protein V8D89_016030 [Ganoderma adspersum]